MEITLQERKETLLDAIKKAVVALYENWKNNGNKFVDIDKMKAGGIYAESVGAVTALLILVGFRTEECIVGDEDIRQQLQTIFDTTFDNIYQQWTTTSCFAEPIIDYKVLTSVRAKDKDLKCTDTITWILSTCVLARYASRRGILLVSESQKNHIFELTAEMLGLLLKSQKDGKWGLLSGDSDERFTLSERSLYFTYGANAALSDFADYILGEIKQVEESEDTDAFNYRDSELIDYLDPALGYKEGVAEAIIKVRRQLSDWLLEECLPRLHRLAKCEGLDPESIGRMRIWRNNVEEDENRRYLDLYYTYYIIDMLICTASDELIISNPEYNKSKLEQNDAFLDEDRKYLEDISTFFQQYISVVLTDAGQSYAAAKATGDAFWDVYLSELPILWYKEGGKSARSINVTDPALISMAMRAKTIFNFYCAPGRDPEIEELFEDDILSNRYDPESGEEKNDDTVNYLWDNQMYNLMITERSIEALVDFSDYLRRVEKIEQDAAAEAAAQANPANALQPQIIYQKSPLDLAMEDAIENYLRSDKGKKVIEDYLLSEEGQQILLSHIPQNSPTSLRDKIMEFTGILQFTSEQFQENKTLDVPKNDKDGRELNKNLFDLFGYLLELKFLDIVKGVKINKQPLDDDSIRTIRENFKNGMRAFLPVFIEPLTDEENYNPKLFRSYWDRLTHL